VRSKISINCDDISSVEEVSDTYRSTFIYMKNKNPIDIEERYEEVMELMR